ncbi:MAG TPA: MraY family glycosyltransferase [Bryobacteraceae bacterium]|nr:MraY family glycosyltransferase [Bryobacteraceae bacterium]
MFLILSLGFLSVILSLLLTPLVRDSIGRLGFLDLPDGIRKKHSKPVPRVGGIAIALAYVSTYAIALVLPFTYTFLLRRALPNILQLSLVACVVFLTGVLDDLVGLNARQKLLGIGGAAALAYAAGIRVDVHLFHLPAWHWLGFAITVLWLAGCANAFNLIDGMDGLAAGIGLVATVTMLIAALTQGNLPLALATMPLAGCLLGFLRYNFNPASVFLGDSGSLLIGFLLACYGALWSEKSVTLVALTVPVLAVSVPLLDVLVSILRRYVRNRPIFQADRGHIHHKLLERGFTHKGAVLTIYAVCGLVALLSLLASAVHNSFAGLIVILFCGAAWLGIRHLEYAEFTMAGRMFLGGKFRRIIDAETRLVDFEAALAKAADIDECWSRIRAGSFDFGFCGARLSLNGAMFEEARDHNSKRRWELRIPLPGGDYVNFLQDFGADTDPLILSQFANAVERGVTAWLKARPAEPVRMPAGQLYYTAAAAPTVKSRAV